MQSAILNIIYMLLKTIASTPYLLEIGMEEFKYVFSLVLLHGNPFLFDSPFLTSHPSQRQPMFLVQLTSPS